MANRQSETTPKKQPDTKQAQPEKREPVDETVWESFPASDPSGSYAGRDIPPDERKN